MARASFYNVPAIAVSIDGKLGSDFGSDFAYRVTSPEDQAEVVVGVDKASTTINRNPTVELEVSFKPTSPTNDDLMEIYDNQINGLGRLFSITINTGVNERLKFNKCALKKMSDFEGAASPGMRNFMFTVQQFQRDTSA